MTTVSGAGCGEGMFRILTEWRPAEQSAPLDGFAVHGLGSLGGARHGELAAGQRSPRLCDVRPKLVVAQHPLEGTAASAAASSASGRMPTNATVTGRSSAGSARSRIC